VVQRASPPDHRDQLSFPENRPARRRLFRTCRSERALQRKPHSTSKQGLYHVTEAFYGSPFIPSNRKSRTIFSFSASGNFCRFLQKSWIHRKDVVVSPDNVEPIAPHPAAVPSIPSTYANIPIHSRLFSAEQPGSAAGKFRAFFNRLHRSSLHQPPLPP